MKIVDIISIISQDQPLCMMTFAIIDNEINPEFFNIRHIDQ